MLFVTSLLPAPHVQEENRWEESRVCRALASERGARRGKGTDWSRTSTGSGCSAPPGCPETIRVVMGEPVNPAHSLPEHFLGNAVGPV